MSEKHALAGIRVLVEEGERPVEEISPEQAEQARGGIIVVGGRWYTSSWSLNYQTRLLLPY